jgi:hypothetical protein
MNLFFYHSNLSGVRAKIYIFLDFGYIPLCFFHLAFCQELSTFVDDLGGKLFQPGEGEYLYGF